MSLTLRQLIELVAEEANAEVTITISPPSAEAAVFDADLWLVNYEPTPNPQAVVGPDGNVYFTNRKKDAQ